MDQLENLFSPLREYGYNKFHITLDANFRKTRTIFNINKCTLTFVGKDSCDYSILPICSVFNDVGGSVRLFGNDRPSARNEQLMKLLSENNLPDRFSSNGGELETFQFAYKISTVICNLVDGGAILNWPINCEQEVWLIILKGMTDEAQKCMTDIKVSGDCEEWYRKIGV
jgi:hypothetical protein